MVPTLLLGGVLALGQVADPEPNPLAVSVVVPPPGPAVVPPAAPAAAATRWPLMRAAQGTWLGALLDDNRTTVYGWTEFSFTTGTARGSNLPVPFVDRPNEFLLNQNYLHVERTLDTARREYQWGFVGEVILPGSDYRSSLARGLANRQFESDAGGPQLVGIDPYQFYLQTFLPDLGPRGTKVVAGRFATHIGYELMQGVDTPFVSRSYLFQYNPFSHAGVWATSQLTDAWAVGNGLAAGSDTVFDTASRLTYLGQVRWAPPAGRTAVTLNAVVSNPRFDVGEAFAFYNVYELILTRRLSDRLTYAADVTYSHVAGVPHVGFTDWYGAAQYLTYQLSPTLSSTARAELFDDPTGYRTGSAGLYTAATAGLAWKPLPELLVRPGVRYDHNNQSRPFEGKPDLFTAVLDVIVRW